MTDFRALCAELLSEYEQCFTIADPSGSPLVQRARAALAETKPKEPMDEDLLQVFDTACLSEGGTVDEIHLRGLRAILARWGQDQ